MVQRQGNPLEVSQLTELVLYELPISIGLDAVGLGGRQWNESIHWWQQIAGLRERLYAQLPQFC